VGGRTLGQYEILRPLGAGGMGEVYRARDSKLKRDVAIKLLPEDVAGDPERLARLQREAELLAALNHPNIAGIYNLEEHDGAHFLVLELVEGETLDARLGRGALPVDEALDLCGQIAEALEAAHDAGIIHRDLKPANVIVTAAGRAKVLDFGIAKALELGNAGAFAAGGDHATTARPTALTGTGMILGTAPYISPEQVRGQPVDARTDIWAFGCILYECLSGRRAFERETVADTLAAIVERDPDWSALPGGIPRAVQRLLERCLQRDLRRRLRHVGDARIEIEEALAEPAKVALADRTDAMLAGASLTARLVPSPSWRRMAPWMVAAVAVLAAALTLLSLGSRPGPAPLRSVMRSSIVLPAEAPLAPPGSFFLAVGRPSLALSPDGSTLVYVALVGDTRQLYRRDMESGDTRAMPGTKDAQGPFFSPDSQWVGFFAEGKLKKVALAGGVPQPLADAVWGQGADWGTDGWIYFSPNETAGVFRVPAASGEVEPVMVGGTRSWPALMPGNEHLLFTFVYPALSIARGKLGGSESSEILVDFGSSGRYAPTGHLVYGRGGRLLAAPFDAGTMSLTGDPAVILDDVRTEATGALQATWSTDGTLIYAPGSDGSVGRLVWIDREGKSRTALDLPEAVYGDFKLSPDGSTLAYTLREGNRSRVWLYELDRGAPRPLTRGPIDMKPAWTLEGDALFFRSTGTEGDGIYRIGVADATEPPVEVSGPRSGRSLSIVVTAEGLLYDEGGDILFAPVADGRVSGHIDEGRPILAAAALEIFPAVSPGGRWLAYTSDETGHWEIYVASFPDTTTKRRVSLAGGEEPRWSPDGREIIYRYGPRWYSVSFSDEPGLTLGGEPTLLFEGPYINVRGYSWDISPDGKRFLVVENPDQGRALTELTVIHNFFDEIQRRAPSRR